MERCPYSLCHLCPKEVFRSLLGNTRNVYYLLVNQLQMRYFGNDTFGFIILFIMFVTGAGSLQTTSENLLSCHKRNGVPFTSQVCSP